MTQSRLLTTFWMKGFENIRRKRGNAGQLITKQMLNLVLWYCGGLYWKYYEIRGI